MGAIDEIPDVPEDMVDEACEAYHDEVDVDYLAVQGSDRLWLKAVQPLILLASKDNSAAHTRVRHAINDMAVAACERAARILRSDLPPFDFGPGDASEDA
jgi:hypothetical protein